MPSLDIAVIGSGIAGLSAAWLLSRSQKVTLFEKASRIGGHSNTVTATMPEGQVAVDTGFIVYNEQNYPNLTAFFDHLGVASAESSMGFAVSVAEGRMEYCGGRHLNGLFGQRRNLVRPEHWLLVGDILKFFKHAESQAEQLDCSVSIADFLRSNGYSKAFIEDHILPISAAIWSTPARGMLDFPAKTFIEFFANHGLLQINGRPQWRTVSGGSKQYVGRILAEERFATRLDAQIKTVIRHAAGVEIFFDDGHREHFDQVIFACHADQALALLGDISAAEQRVLSAFRFTLNRAVLHTDENFMPRRKNLWSSWNYLRTERAGADQLSLTYWMNQLQPLATASNVFVTLNPARDFAPGSVQQVIDYEHPLFDTAAMAAQRRLWEIQGVQRTWFAGAWMGYGFHEDGLQAGLEVAERIGPVMRPWTVGEARGRIAHNWVEGDRLQWAAE